MGACRAPRTAAAPGIRFSAFFGRLPLEDSNQRLQFLHSRRSRRPFSFPCFRRRQRLPHFSQRHTAHHSSLPNSSQRFSITRVAIPAVDPRWSKSNAAFCRSASRSGPGLRTSAPSSDARTSSAPGLTVASDTDSRGCRANSWCPRSWAMIADSEKSSGSASRSNASAYTVKRSVPTSAPRPYCAPAGLAVYMPVLDPTHEPQRPRRSQRR